MDDNTLPINETVEEESPQEEKLPQEENPQVQNEISNEHCQDDIIDTMLHKLGVSDSTATAARAIIDSLDTQKTPTESFVKLIIKALNHDEDIKNAETAGYLRGRNEVIEAATKPENQDSKPVNFPIYRKRSFWDR